jgi:hypothetical protein
MNPEIWGPNAWIFLHTITLNYPNNPSIYDKQYYKNFFMSLQTVLPCEWCSKNYKLHITKYPIDNYLNSKKDLVTWLILIHNEVNEIFKKKKLNYNEVIEIYKNLYNNNNKNTLSLNWYIIIIGICITIFIIICIIILYLYKSKFQSYLPF